MPQYVAYVQKAQQDFRLLAPLGGGGGDRENAPSGEAAMEMYANGGNWDMVYQLAGGEGPEVVQRFASLHAKALVNQAKYLQALSVISE